MTLITLLVGALASIISGEFPLLQPSVIAGTVWAAGMGLLWMVEAKVSLRSLLNTLSGNVIDSIDSAADLDDLRNGLERLGNTRRQLLLSLGLGLIALMWPMVWNKMGVKPPGGGITLYDGSERLESRQGAIQCTQRGRTRRGCLAGSIYAIQAKIEKLETQGDIGSKETMEAIGRLMDYHDRIKAAPDSALDIIEVLRFLQALLLPLIASLLANIGQITNLLSTG